MKWKGVKGKIFQTGVFYIYFSLFMSGYLGKYTLPVVTSDLKLAAECGYKIMEKGGNAVDAAVTTAIAVGAMNAFASGLGGGGFLLVKIPDGKCFEYNFRERAPASANANNYKNKEDSSAGRKSIAVPSELMGLIAVHTDFGILPWEDLFPEIIKILEDGFLVPRVLAQKLKEFQGKILNDRGLYEAYTRNGKILQENDLLQRRNLARTLKEISRDPSSFFTGEISKSLLEFINSEGTVILPEELSQQQVTRKEVFPEIVNKTEIYTTTLPTTGYMLRLAAYILEHIKTTSTPSEELLQSYLIRIYNELYSIRTELEDLQDEQANTNSLQIHLQNRTVADTLLQSIIGSSPFSPNKNSVVEDHGTTHINIIDKDGMIVALTSTINQYWGSGLMDPVTGIILNNQIDDFTFSDFATYSGIKLTGSTVNQIKPYKQPLSSAMPSIIKRDNDLYIIGGSGGIRIPTAIISTVARIFLCDDPIDKAIDTPRLHYQGGRTIKVEGKYTSTLPKMGVNWLVLRDDEDTISSCVHIIKYNIKDKSVTAKADRRKDAAVVGREYLSADRLDSEKKKEFVSFSYRFDFSGNLFKAIMDM
ncbi:gamma-glutamyltranspeptidase / glutathione hydrolase / leukotriene-C4 hydrolase [Nematocida ausubeli]|uniref:Glutathione hydrolase n=1 Tax=Nematocida ausubeli (strain ATCC PRA-371 / ERTm2) TaxID=1913371 RepID=A0A086J5H9_NEMA1|nr:uncharacterized protein NESG_00475 [Nematocida ausubeli]KAI5138580.1 gamma-glutamyltranspeptidase / glutathione hydrolase / leukotriene-C4 hydrolase [Nematocida ausubeli]KAI5151122.1 gamma-glutamyltranspeptidase / glutathione hydrolase / leukotriene-C4 hydrolase [Nematocida ausubeli]KAI5164624.1 gamma-glutamyltranspeptidase / glutathione hydrolase / leukotriene-C4 hydrolase [Nematocida ausubeli]KFG27397.1 hypothetical protein NESG_00475 [Nematocida ausubeli]